MAKMIILTGLVASGKSTLASQLLQQYGNAIRINKDLLRTMLHCDTWSQRHEATTQTAARIIAKYVLEAGTLDHYDATAPGVIVIDETNLNPKTLASWKQLAEMCGASWEVIDLPTPVDECLRRDRLRAKPVGDHVILGMALQSHRYPMPAHGIVLCDIDGTVAETSHRVPYLQQNPKDWHGFFQHMAQDPVRTDIVAQVREQLAAGAELFMVSGRPDTYREETEWWLRHKAGLPFRALFMRRGGDKRPDTVVKQQILETYFPDPYRQQIRCVFDDRPSVIREVWVKAGLNVVDCGTGEEF